MIRDLRECKQHIPTLVAWHHQEWAHLNPGQTIQQRADEMEECLGIHFVPSTFVWEEAGEAVGSASILACDMDSHPECSPWLASVFVREDRRGEGIGTALVQHAMTMASSNQIRTLFLFTPDQELFYQRLGWQWLSQETYHGDDVTLMRIDFDSVSATEVEK